MRKGSNPVNTLNRSQTQTDDIEANFMTGERVMSVKHQKQMSFKDIIQTNDPNEKQNYKKKNSKIMEYLGFDKKEEQSLETERTERSDLNDEGSEEKSFE